MALHRRQPPGGGRGGRTGPPAPKPDARADRRMEARRDRRQEAEADRDARRPGHPPGSGGTTPGGTDTTQDREAVIGGTSGSPALTSATTTAPEPDTESADDAEAFFSSGHGSAMHYDRTEQQATADSTAAGG